jgi:acyl-CoA reductase-like NAD-dependent aldehyde dehydrogenase
MDAPEKVIAGIQRAREAQRLWGATSFRERADHVRSIREYIVAHAERIADIIAQETGKTRIDAISTEVLPAAMAADYYARHARRVLKRRRVRGANLLLINKRSYLDRVPLGVVGIISPWNYPFSIPFHEIIMALMAGNGVVLKVATQTQQVAGILAECVAAGRLPDGLFVKVNLPGSKAAEAFLQGGVNKIFFTGSVEAGKDLMARAAKHMVPVSLELGGNDPMIVCADANLYRAAAGAAWAGFSNCGQSCGGVERVYVDTKVYDEFMSLLREMTRSLRYGSNAGFNVDVGSMTTPQQLRKVTEHVQDALSKGAIVGAVSRTLDGPPGGLYYPPTILESMTDDMLPMSEEMFGPVLSVVRVENIDEAISKANDSSLGLTASVWTRDHKRGRSIAARLEAGTVTINDHLMSHGMAETPWGGFKQSGIGRTHGALGLEEMTQPRCVVDDILPGVQRNMWWYPHGRDVYKGLLGALRALYGSGLAVRFKGLKTMTQLFRRTFTREK